MLPEDSLAAGGSPGDSLAAGGSPGDSVTIATRRLWGQQGGGIGQKGFKVISSFPQLSSKFWEENFYDLNYIIFHHIFHVIFFLSNFLDSKHGKNSYFSKKISFHETFLGPNKA